jgi:serine/threonine protein kinase
MHPLDRCLLHPPAPGATGDSTIQLKIVDLVRAGDRHCAQLVTVQMDHVPPTKGLPIHENLLAKFYDPLYFNHEQDDVDPFLFTNQDYSIETAIYNKVPFLQGTIIPRFYGLFTLELPVPEKSTTRPVRLILMERVPGKSMDQLRPKDYSQSERQDIMKVIIDAESLLYTHGVWHKDVHPRNVMLVIDGSSVETPRPRVVIIDFGKAWINRSQPLCP